MLRVAEQYSATDTGRQRRANEDSLLARSPLFVVADGMGGAQAGEVASRIAVESFQHELDGPADPEGRLAARALAANARIHELSQHNSEHAGMGTTLTAVYVGEEEVAIAHVGDSRAYCLRDGELTRLTDDHSLVDELIREGKLTPEEAEDHPQRSVITRALGPEAAVEVDTRSYRARPGDVYLLCSDGLTTMVPEVRVAALLREHPRLRDAGEALITAANDAGGRDNVTVVLLRLEEVHMPAGSEPADEHTTLTGMEAVGAMGIPGGLGRASAADEDQTTAAGEDDWTSAGASRGAPASALATTAGRPAVSPSAASAAPAATAARRRRPRQPTAAPSLPAPSRRRRLRRAGASLVVLAVVGLLAAGAYVASQSVYFIATNSRGLVTVFRGVPYELPAGIKLYSSDFVSGVSAATLTPERRRTLLDHSLRSEGDAADLVRSLELGQLSG